MAICAGLHGRRADRLANRVQLTTDGHRAYLNAVEEAFGADIDYAMLVKHVRRAPEDVARAPLQPRRLHRRDQGRVSTATPIRSTSARRYVERSNLTMRMHIAASRG